MYSVDVPRIDVHSHLLPGLDDGCLTVDESLACVRALKSKGYVGTICTPHILSDIYPQNQPEVIAAEVAQLAQVLESHDLEYRLWTGGEVRLAENTVSWLTQVGVPTLGDSRYVLIDYFGTSWPVFADETCEFLLSEGYQPLLAHPERLKIEIDECLDLLASLQDRGIKLQGNLKCLAGNEGRRVQSIALSLLEQDRYHVLAMDMHGRDSLDERFEGLATVADAVGEERLTLLTSVRPKEILFSDS